MLPFTAEVFFSVFEQYNRAIWPAQVIAYGLGLIALVATFRPAPGSDRLIGAVLATGWVWMGVVYHFGHFATINFIAPLFGVLFVIQGLLFAWTVTLRGKVAFRFGAGVLGWAGLGLAIFAMLIYPIIGWFAGHGWPRTPMFGVAPCPTTIYTMGMLLLTAGRTPLHLVVIPVLWSLIGGSAAWLLGVWEDIALPLAGMGGLCLILWGNRRRTGR